MFNYGKKVWFLNSYLFTIVKVTKKAAAGETCTKVVELNKKERGNEIERMLAGIEVNKERLATTEKMIEHK